MSSFFGYSSTSGTGTAPQLSPSSNPKRSSCPSIFLRPSVAMQSSTASTICMRARRFTPRLSKAPDLMRLSTARRPSSLPAIRRQNSSKPVNGPFSLRSCISCWINFSPIFFIATSPKRMFRPETVKRASDSFTSGGRTLMPMSRHSEIYSATLPVESSTLVSSAAIYSQGQWHFI